MAWLLGGEDGTHPITSPKCAACQFGKQGHIPTPGKHHTKDPPGALSQNALSPGDLTHSNQFESRQPGRTFTSCSLSSPKLQFQGGAIFCDVASHHILVHFQVGLGTGETIRSKQAYEQDCLNAGVQVKLYHTDNGIYTSHEFMKELAKQGSNTQWCQCSLSKWCCGECHQAGSTKGLHNDGPCCPLMAWIF